MTSAKFEWKYRYVADGQLEPDQFGRWAIDCYMFFHVDKSMPQYKFAKEAIGNPYIPIRVATMCQKDCLPSGVPSLVHRFCVSCPSFEECGNFGFSHERNFFSNDIEELKKIVEHQFNQVRNIFKHSK